MGTSLESRKRLGEGPRGLGKPAQERPVQVRAHPQLTVCVVTRLVIHSGNISGAPAVSPHGPVRPGAPVQGHPPQQRDQEQGRERKGPRH